MKIINGQEYYKIRELGDISNRSKQAIYKNIEKLNIENIEHIYINNVLYIHKNFLEKIDKFRAKNRQK